MKQMLTTKDISRTLQLSNKTILIAIKEGRLKACKVGGVWRFREEDVLLFVNGQIQKNPVELAGTPGFIVLSIV